MEHYSTYKQAALRPGMQKLAKLCLKCMELDYKYRVSPRKRDIIRMEDGGVMFSPNPVVEII
jgi:hypothetical protein